jgi:fatty acid desaturase
MPHTEADALKGTDTSASARPINWYRSPLPPGRLRELNQRNDARGLLQALGHLGLILCSGVLVVVAAEERSWWLLAALFLHGTFCAFLTNAAHELCHGTVFSRPWLNTLFLNVFSFIRWFPHEFYRASHSEHHRYTLHPPQDLEVVLPLRFSLPLLILRGVFDPGRLKETLSANLRYARGRFEGEWELRVLARAEQQAAVSRWARILLTGHGTIMLAALLGGYWVLPLLLSLTPCFGGLCFSLCNNTQQAGLKDNVSDFRLCCRTMPLNPMLEFLYWYMNYHTEHHMYAAVPCYRLRELHAEIRHDLPPMTRGLWHTWREILRAQVQGI